MPAAGQCPECDTYLHGDTCRKCGYVVLVLTPLEPPRQRQKPATKEEALAHIAKMRAMVSDKPRDPEAELERIAIMTEGQSAD